MRYFLSDHDWHSQRPSLNTELCSVAVLISGAQEARGQATSTAYKRNLLSEYARGRTSSSGLRSVGYVSRLPGAVARLMRLAPVMAGLALLLAPVCSRAQTTLGTQTLYLNLSAAGLLYGFPNSITLTKTGTVFNSYTGILQIQYKARTSSGGSGTITVEATTDFPCASGGPCIATPPTAGDALTYTCSGATLGSNCSGTQTVSTTASTNVVSIGASACTGGGSPCSTADPNTVNVSFALTNDPKYKTGSYSATLTFTISAT